MYNLDHHYNKENLILASVADADESRQDSAAEIKTKSDILADILGSALLIFLVLAPLVVILTTVDRLDDYEKIIEQQHLKLISCDMDTLAANVAWYDLEYDTHYLEDFLNAEGFELIGAHGYSERDVRKLAEILRENDNYKLEAVLLINRLSIETIIELCNVDINNCLAAEQG